MRCRSFVHRLLWMLLLTLAIAGPSTAVPPASTIVSGCNGCHGDAGISSSQDIPSVGGMSAFYIEAQLVAYQKRQRPCSNTAGDMCDLSKALTPAQIRDIGLYYSSAPWTSASQPGQDAVRVAKGRRLHAITCENCHTMGGSVSGDDAGILRGQWLPYLQSTLASFRSGGRPMGATMKRKLDALSDDDVDALTRYYASDAVPSKH